MEVSFEKKNNILMIKIKGEIDHHTSALLRQEIDQKLDRIYGKHLLFCFADVTFMDSSGIGVLIGRYKRVQGLGGKAAVACAEGRILEIFHMSALDKLIPSFPSEKEAIAYLEGGREK